MPAAATSSSQLRKEALAEPETHSAAAAANANATLASEIAFGVTSRDARTDASFLAQAFSRAANGRRCSVEASFPGSMTADVIAGSCKNLGRIFRALKRSLPRVETRHEVLT